MVMDLLIFVSMLFSVICRTFFRIFWFLFLLNDNETIVLEISHLLVVEGGSKVLFLFFARFLLVSVFSLVVLFVVTSASSVVTFLVLTSLFTLFGLSGFVGSLVVGFVWSVSVLFLRSSLLFGLSLAFSRSSNSGGISVDSCCLLSFWS